MKNSIIIGRREFLIGTEKRAKPQEKSAKSINGKYWYDSFFDGYSIEELADLLANEKETLVVFFLESEERVIVTYANKLVNTKILSIVVNEFDDLVKALTIISWNSLVTGNGEVLLVSKAYDLFEPYFKEVKNLGVNFIKVDEKEVLNKVKQCQKLQTQNRRIFIRSIFIFTILFGIFMGNKGIKFVEEIINNKIDTINLEIANEMKNNREVLKKLDELKKAVSAPVTSKRLHKQQFEKEFLEKMPSKIIVKDGKLEE